MQPPLFDTAASGNFAYLALLGHVPEAALPLDAEGWAEVPYLLRALKAEGHMLSRFHFERLVLADPAQRFVLSADRRHIRAASHPHTNIVSYAVAAAVG
jgi:RNA:NAD 2'-phosphotransferase (TPT1/KptA family)